MADSKLINFFKDGGVYYFDEDNGASEQTFYKVEDLMGEPEGEDIIETEVDEDGMICVFYDCSVLSDDEAKEKYLSGDYVVSI